MHACLGARTHRSVCTRALSVGLFCAFLCGTEHEIIAGGQVQIYGGGDGGVVVVLVVLWWWWCWC